MSNDTSATAKARGAKEKPASHAFRVSTDDVRQGFRRQRMTELAGLIERRRVMADAIGNEAAVPIPREDGFAFVPPGAFDFAPVVSAAREVVARADLAAKREKSNKAFLVKVAEKDDLTLASPLLQLGLDRRLVAVAARYLGMVPILEYANVLYSSHAGDELAKSQLFHCDSDEIEQVKLFVLCEDVSPAHGPLTFLNASDSQRVRDHVGYKFKTRLTDDQVRDALGGEVREHALLGPAGVAGLIDTSRCLHYGSRFADSSTRRVVVMLQYVTPLAFVYATDHRTSARFRDLAASDSDEMTSLVLGRL